MLQALRGKQMYHVTNVGVEKLKLSRLLVQHNNEFKMKEIVHRSPLSITVKFKTVLTNSNCK